MNDSFRWLGSFFVAALGAVVLYSLWAASVGWGTPIVQQYEFVQAKAAIGAYYIAQGGPIVRYEMPILGPPWSVPYEFPFFQVAAAYTHTLFGFPLESAGRIVGKICFYLSCVPLFLIARNLGFRGRSALVPVALFLASPLYLFWSRQFMNEATATFLALAYLAAFMQAEEHAAWWGAALVFGVMAALSKSTTYAAFALAAGMFLAARTVRRGDYSVFRLARGAAVLILPFVAGLLWVKFTDQVKNENPLGYPHTSAGLANWYLGSGWSERTGGALWNHIFRITIHDSIGHRAAWILSVLFALCLGRRAWLYWLCSLLFLVAPLLFTHAFLLHDYYANANAVFLVFAAASLVQAAVSSANKVTAGLGVAFFVVVLGYDVKEFLGKGYFQQQERRMGPIDFAHKLRALVPAGEVMLMWGEDWCPVIPFYAERRAVMLQNGGWYSPRLKESLALLHAEGKKVGVVVLCHEARTNPELISRISLGPLLLRDTCDVYQNNGKY